MGQWHSLLPRGENGVEGGNEIRHAINRLGPVEPESTSDVCGDLWGHAEAEPSSAETLEVERRVREVDRIPWEPDGGVRHERGAGRSCCSEEEWPHHVMGSFGREEAIRSECRQRSCRGGDLLERDGHQAEIELHAASLARSRPGSPARWRP